MHGGLGAFIGHTTGEGTRSLGVIEIRTEPEAEGVRVRLVAALVASLAHCVALVFGLRTIEIAALSARMSVDLDHSALGVDKDP